MRCPLLLRGCVSLETRPREVRQERHNSILCHVNSVTRMLYDLIIHIGLFITLKIKSPWYVQEQWCDVRMVTHYYYNLPHYHCNDGITMVRIVNYYLRINREGCCLGVSVITQERPLGVPGCVSLTNHQVFRKAYCKAYCKA